MNLYFLVLKTLQFAFIFLLKTGDLMKLVIGQALNLNLIPFHILMIILFPFHPLN